MLHIFKSTLQDAGKGLFTDTVIEKGKIVCEYEGEKITWKEAERRNDLDKGGYVYYINEKNCVDAWDYTKTFGRYANDAAGISRIRGIRNNSTYDVVRGRVYIRATRTIRAGEEIFVSYGRQYWNIVRGELNLPKGYVKYVKPENKVRSVILPPKKVVKGILWKSKEMKKPEMV
jgi:SET domain-containing protein